MSPKTSLSDQVDAEYLTKTIVWRNKTAATAAKRPGQAKSVWKRLTCCKGCGPGRTLPKNDETQLMKRRNKTPPPEATAGWW